MMGTQVINSGNTVRIFDTNYNYTVQHDITSVLTGVYLVQEETSTTVPEPDTDPDTDVPADVPVPFGFAALGLGLLAFGRRK